MGYVYSWQRRSGYWWQLYKRWSCLFKKWAGKNLISYVQINNASEGNVKVHTLISMLWMLMLCLCNLWMPDLCIFQSEAQRHIWVRILLQSFYTQAVGFLFCKARMFKYFIQIELTFCRLQWQDSKEWVFFCDLEQVELLEEQVLSCK